MEILIWKMELFYFIYDKRKSTLSITQNCKSYFSQSEEKRRLFSMVKAKISNTNDTERRDSAECSLNSSARK